MSFFAKGDQKSLIQGLIDVMHEFVAENFVKLGQIFVILRKSFKFQPLNFAEKNLVKLKKVKSSLLCGNYSILEFCHEMHNFVVK